jgi:hypothetical protein
MASSIHLARILALLAGVSLATTVAQADTLLDTFSTFAATGTQVGRLSRNGQQPQDWSGAEPFPGALNLTTVYGYETFTINTRGFSFIQIMFDDPLPNLFISAYHDAYTPVSTGTFHGLDANWLGDAATSGDFFGVDPLFFQVVMPAGSTSLVIPINQVFAGSVGVGEPFELLVEGFYDTDYTNSPEPSYVILVGCVLTALVVLRRKKHVLN